LYVQIFTGQILIHNETCRLISSSRMPKL
jgi:hypothetical protein